MGKRAGIYAITCNPTGYQYIGSAEDLDDRWKTHRGLLRAGGHHNAPLQKAWRKYGEAEFSFTVLEETSIEELVEKEQYYLDTLKPRFNIREKATRAISGRLQRKPCTIRLPIECLEKLRRAANALGRSQSSIVEEALNDYFKKYDLNSRYQLHVTENKAVLMRIGSDQVPFVVEVQDRNGAPPKEMVTQYRLKLREPVSLVESSEEELWPDKKQS